MFLGMFLVCCVLVGVQGVCGLGYRGELLEVDEGRYRSKYFMGVGLFLVDRTRLLKGGVSVNEKILELYGRKEFEKEKRLYMAEKGSVVVVVLTLSCVLATLLMYYNNQNILIDYIEKPDFGKGDIKRELSYEVEVDGDIHKGNVYVNIPEKLPNDEEVMKAMALTAEKLGENILLENKSLNEVSTPLNLMKKNLNYGFSIRWKSSNENILLPNGVIIYENVNRKKAIQLEAIIEYEEMQHMVTLDVVVVPRQFAGKEQVKEVVSMIDEQVERISEIDGEGRYVTLPEEVLYANSIRWYEGGSFADGVEVLIMGVIITGCIYGVYDYSLKQKVDMRLKSIQREFPSFANKFVLLINAGMNFNRAWKKVSDDYVYRLNFTGEALAIYEEMLRVNEQIANGVSYIDAYKRFGHRCQIPEVQRFTASAIQNMKKGGDQLVESLKEQRNEALEIRKNEARMEGEKASTKLILPMGIMLIAILLLIVTPITMSFSV